MGPVDPDVVERSAEPRARSAGSSPDSAPLARPPTAGRRLDVAGFVVVLAFALTSALGTNPYHYGLFDNSMTIPFVKAVVDPSLYPGDYVLQQRPYYYTYLWDALGHVSARLHIGLPQLFFAVYFAALFLTFLAIYRLAVTLFGRREVGVLALTFLAFGKPTFGGVEVVESLLSTRQVAMPIVLFAITFFLNRRTALAFCLLGIAYLVHPLTTHYVLAMLLVAGIVEARRSGLKSLMPGLLVFLALASPVLAWRFRSVPVSLRWFSADPTWVAALHARSSHHMFPLAWGWTALFHAAVLLVLFGVGWRYAARTGAAQHRVILTFTGTILAFCGLGIVLSQARPMGALFLFQPLRSAQFLEYFAALYMANFWYREMERASSLQKMVPPTLLTAGVYYAAPRVPAVLALYLGLFAYMALVRLARRSSLGGMRFAVVATCLCCMVGGALFVRHAVNPEGGGFRIQDAQDAAWLDVQRWARQHTAVEDAFVVPPIEKGAFRVESERSVYADWMDGGLMNANPAFGHEWLRRMRMVGFTSVKTLQPDYCNLRPTQLLRVAEEMGLGSRRVFFVTKCERKDFRFPVAYRNPRYLVYEIRKGLA